MKSLLTVSLLIALVALAVALVCYYFARLTYKGISKEYESLLKKRTDELLEMKKDNARLSQALAELQGEMSAIKTRFNTAQVEFFDVPKVRR